jgi:hypothetical protein
MLTTLARNRIALYRTSNEVIDPYTPTTLTDGSPRVTITADALNTARYQSIVSVVCSPAPSSTGGFIEIEGEDNEGNEETERIAVPVSGVAQGLDQFGLINRITFEGAVLNNLSISVKFMGQDGGSVKARRTLLSCTPAQIRRGRGQYVAQREGTVQRETIVVMLPYMCSTTAIPREGDLIKDLDTLAEFIVTGAPLIQQVGISRFYELTAQRYQGG